MIGLDTNALLRYLLRDDAAQAARAAREIERDERFLIDGIVLCELAWVLETGYGFSRAEFLTMRVSDVQADGDTDIPGEPRLGGLKQHRLKDGQVIDVEISSHTFRFARRKGFRVSASSEAPGTAGRFPDSVSVRPVGRACPSLTTATTPVAGPTRAAAVRRRLPTGFSTAARSTEVRPQALSTRLHGTRERDYRASASSMRPRRSLVGGL